MTIQVIAMLAVFCFISRQTTVRSCFVSKRTFVRRSRNVLHDPSCRAIGGGSNNHRLNDKRKLTGSIDLLLRRVLSRAGSTLTCKSTGNSTQAAAAASTNDKQAKVANYEEELQLQRHLSLHYNSNPTIATTALAHLLWKTILRPGIDSAIDATAGNGNDSLAIANILFPLHDITSTSTASKLYCIDIQQQACETTRQRLELQYPVQLEQDRIHIMKMSHAPLAITRQNSSSVALVVYNLGFLPQSNNKEQCITTPISTLESLIDASLLLRVGGLLSVTTYPRTNQLEHEMAYAFLECLALLTSNTQDWNEYIESLSQLDSGQKDSLRKAVEYVQQSGPPRQTWRVYQHAKVGWTDAPILLTATRIK
ncbi:hypothetical protein MPSEU_000884100 [Mayamaea pseudoterrestris]|nr:hypothetical protein MPSEU_000884100 [Mayamaea pseudoterrestris]